MRTQFAAIASVVAVQLAACAPSLPDCPGSQVLISTGIGWKCGDLAAAPAGPTGSIGASGQSGSTGETGSTGGTGSMGTSGATGATGYILVAVTLNVAANPNSVLSAVATVSWTGPVSSVSITYEGGSTPSVDLTSLSSPATIPILGIAASATYAFQVSAIASTGEAFASNFANLTTGALPSDLPTFTATGTPAGSGLTLVALQESNYATILNSAGATVWYYETPDGGNVDGDFQQQPDGTFTVNVTTDATHTLPIPGVSGQYLQVDVLGNLIHTWNALGADGTGDVIDTNGNAITLIATDLHDIRLQPDGSALLFGWIENDENLKAFHGVANAAVYLDVLVKVAADGTILWAWNSAEYFTPADADPTAVSLERKLLSITHGNAIDVMADGNYLVSFRNLSQVVKIDSMTGAILWKLGGAGISTPASGGPVGDFTFPDDLLGGFSCQHGVRELPNGHIILFDNGVGHATPQSRAVEYALDTTAMTATVVWESNPSVALYTPYFGFGERFANGNTLVAYGYAKTVEEWDPLGMNVLWTLTYPGMNSGIYRAYRLGSLYAYSMP